MILDAFHKRIWMFLCAALLTCATAAGQMPGRGGSPSPGQTSPSAPGEAPGQGTLSQGINSPSSFEIMDDKAFVKNALEGEMAEVQLGQLAASKGSSEDVRQFGQKMAEDHAKLGDEMKQVAQQVGVNPPSQLSKKDRELKAKLSGLSGPQFDDAYIKAMVKDHKKDESAFKSEAQMAQIPAVKQAAEQGATVISSHLKMIRQIAQAHNLESKSKSNGAE